jgi:hypothetical protein
MSLYERHVPCELIERYALHRFKARLMGDIPSTFTADGRVMKIRCTRESSAEWAAVLIPTLGARISFHLEAHVRDRVDRRRGSRDLGMALDWLGIKAAELGLELSDADAYQFVMPVAHPVRPFLKRPWRFVGLGIVRGPTLFEAAIGRGIGNAKTYGLGFLEWEVE